MQIKAIFDQYHNLIANQVEVPSTELGKMKGLLLYKEVPPLFAMVFENAKQIHMMFMRTSIDVMHLDHQKKILHVGTIHPWRWGPYIRKTKWIVEAKEGSFKEIKMGDFICFE